tara:strand:+ start:96 stop:548 length:453 start_codon:yes stop_codon:yes gene_type:complete
MKMTEIQKMYLRARGRWSRNLGKEEEKKKAKAFDEIRDSERAGEFGTDKLTTSYCAATPGQTNEARGEDSKGHYRGTEKGAGMTKAGVAATNRKTGGNLKTAVTGNPKPGSKDANRRKSFCARMGGMKGPMKDEKGRPTRKAMSLKRWKC